MSTSMAIAWTASPVGTASLKVVSPPGTNGTLFSEPPPATVTVPAMAVTSASMTVVSVTFSCPATVSSSTSSSMVDTHSDSTVPLDGSGLQPSDVSLTSQSSPSTAGSG